MNTRQLVRLSLWFTAPFNLLFGLLFAIPASMPGQLILLPAVEVSFFTVFSGAMVALFGAMYIWMAMQEEIPGALLGLGAIGKFIAVLVAFSLYLTGDLAWLPAMVLTGDLAFVVLWSYYLTSHP